MERQRQQMQKTPHEDDEQSDPNDCVVVAQLTEDEANVIEDLERPIFDSWSSDDEFANLIERAKKKTDGNCERQ